MPPGYVLPSQLRKHPVQMGTEVVYTKWKTIRRIKMLSMRNSMDSFASRNNVATNVTGVRMITFPLSVLDKDSC